MSPALVNPVRQAYRNRQQSSSASCFLRCKGIKRLKRFARSILEYIQVTLEVVDGVSLCIGRADDNLIRLEATHETICRLIVAAEEHRKAIYCYAWL